MLCDRTGAFHSNHVSDGAMFLLNLPRATDRLLGQGYSFHVCGELDDVVENTHIDRWPTDLPVVVSESSQLRPYLDPVFDELHNGVPLLRLKVTRLTCSKEFVLGISFSHLIGDAGSFALFLDDLSRLYQDLEPRSLRPVFDRCLWPNEKPDLALIATMKN